MECSDTSPEIARAKLRKAVADCSERGLYSASRWAAELLNAVPPSPQPSTSAPEAPPAFSTSTPSRPGPSLARQSLFPGMPATVARHTGTAASSPAGHQPDQSSFAFSPLGMAARNTRAAVAGGKAPAQQQQMDLEQDGIVDEDQDAKEQDAFMLGKSYFDCREYNRAAAVLKDCLGPKARFLGLYSDYLAGEKMLQDDSGHVLGPKDNMRRLNPKIMDVLKALKDATDPFLLYLKGIVLSRLNKRLEAISCLVSSVASYPYNWSAWTKLAALIDRSEELTAVEELLPDSFMSRIFGIHAVLEIHSATDALQERINDLIACFPSSLHLQSQRALINYHLREFDVAEEIFDDIAERDPYRLEDVDTYSNILYVMEKRAKLSQLAQRYTELDRHRPETCCLVGNYYSLRGDHTRAIAHFRRALRLDKEYLSAWTLMGHEFVELKNTHAAIEAYRRAIDVNSKDYRAWYGLGQTYEILDMFYYAVTYFQRSAALRPYDSRMWSALGGCYEKLGNLNEAFKAHKRSLLSSEPSDMSAFERICMVCEQMGKPDLAAQFHRRAIEAAIAEDLDLSEYQRSLMALAKYELEVKDSSGLHCGDFETAERCLNKLAASNSVGDAKDQAKNMLKRLQILQLL